MHQNCIGSNDNTCKFSVAKSKRSPSFASKSINYGLQNMYLLKVLPLPFSSCLKNKVETKSNNDKFNDKNGSQTSAANDNDDIIN